MIRGNLARLLVPSIRNAVQKRCQSAVGGPPTQRVSTTEKVVLGGGMTLSLLFIPGWVVYHIREYKGEK